MYDSPVTNTKQRITYSQLLDEVEVFAGVLREEGVKKGDVVMMAAFAHAGDFAGAAAVKWGGR